MKINTKLVIKDILGNDIEKPKKGEKFTIGEALATILIDSPAGEKMKLYLLAKAFANEKEVTIDKADLKLVSDAVENTTKYNNLVNGQLLTILADCK